MSEPRTTDPAPVARRSRADRVLRWGALAAFVAVLLAGGLTVVRKNVTLARPIVVSTPSFTGLFNRSSLPLKPDSRTCIGPVVLDPSADNVQVLGVVNGTGPHGLRALVTAPGYRSLTPFAEPAARGVDARLVAQLATPPPRTADARICVLAGPRSSAALVGTTETRSFTRATTTQNGVQAPVRAASWVYAKGQGSLLQQRSAVAEHAAAFAPNPFGSGLLLVLGFAVCVLVPGLVGWAIVAATRRDEAA